MGIVELDGDLVGELLPGALGLLKAAHNIIERCCHPEVLLLQSQLFTLLQVVVGVQHGTDGLSPLLVGDSSFVVAIVELGEIEFASGRLARPESQVVCSGCSVTRDGDIVGNGLDNVAAFPDKSSLAIVVGLLADLAVELNLLSQGKLHSIKLVSGGALTLTVMSWRGNSQGLKSNQ